LTLAKLQLTLTPTNSLITTDTVRFGDLMPTITSPIQDLPVGVTETISINLLDFFTSDEILNVLFSGGGLIPMKYQDDSIVSFAQLDLSNDPRSSVPEPGLTVGLVALGVVNTLTRLRRKSR